MQQRSTPMPSHTGEWDFDFIVIGSGFGGSVTAHRLVEKGYRVAVMEMGLRWTPENLPRTSWSIHRWFWSPNLALRGFFNMRYFRHVTILHGCAVGGGSITYACTLLQSPAGGPDGQTFPGPYFGGEGPERTTCVGCGGCMMGCHHGAKNTLDEWTN